MSHDQLFVDAAGDERREHWPRAGRPEGVEPAVGQVGDARGEPEAEQMRQGEGVIADAAAIGVMSCDAQIRFMIEQAVDHIGGLTGRRDRHRVVRRLASGKMRVEQRGDLAPIMGVDRTDSPARPAGREVLAIRAGHIGGAEQGWRAASW